LIESKRGFLEGEGGSSQLVGTLREKKKKSKTTVERKKPSTSHLNGEKGGGTRRLTRSKRKGQCKAYGSEKREETEVEEETSSSHEKKKRAMNHHQGGHIMKKKKVMGKPKMEATLKPCSIKWNPAPPKKRKKRGKPATVEKRKIKLKGEGGKSGKTYSTVPTR